MIKEFIKKNEITLPALSYHTASLCNNIIIIFGGLLDKDKINSDIFILKKNAKNFTKISKNLNFSQNFSRFLHSANYDPEENKLYVFGGYDLKAPYYLNDLIVIDVNYPEIDINRINNIGGISQRCNHASFIDERKLYIYGGVGIDSANKNINILNDFHYFDFDSGEVCEVLAKGGAEMKNKTFKATKLELNSKKAKYAFFL